MLETDYDEHVKAHQLVQKWDKAHDSYKKLYRLKHKSMGLFRELGRSIAYERALARVGLKREDIAHHIYGSQIGSTHNYKRTRTVKMCNDTYCDAARKPQKGDVCQNCGNPLSTVQVPLSMSDLHRNFARHILGVETHDGRRVWFDEPLPPEAEMESESEEVETPRSIPPNLSQIKKGEW